jgi:hypothetical protein
LICDNGNEFSPKARIAACGKVTTTLLLLRFYHCFFQDTLLAKMPDIVRGKTNQSQTTLRLEDLKPYVHVLARNVTSRKITAQRLVAALKCEEKIDDCNAWITTLRQLAGDGRELVCSIVKRMSSSSSSASAAASSSSSSASSSAEASSSTAASSSSSANLEVPFLEGDGAADITFSSGPMRAAPRIIPKRTIGKSQRSAHLPPSLGAAVKRKVTLTHFCRFSIVFVNR